MSSDDLFRQVPDELFRKVSKRPERGLPDALFGPPPVPEGPDEPAVPPAPDEPASIDVAADELEPVADEPAHGYSESDAHESVGSSSVAEDEADGAGIALSPPMTEAAELDDVPVAETLPDEVPEPELPDPTLEVVEAAVLAEESGADTPDVSSADTTFSAADVVPVAEMASGTDAVAADSAAVVEAEPVVGGETALEQHTDAAVVDPSAEPKTKNEPHRRPVLLVIADSLAYFGPEGGLPADDPRIWPNLVAAELDWDVELIGRIGWTCRDAYWALIGDPRVWSAIPHAGAVVFAVGGMDTLPSPLPTALRELIRYLRPPWLRRWVRDTYQWLQPKLAKLGRPVALPPKVSVDYLEQSRAALMQLRAELPIVAVLPSVHNCDAYGRVHRGREPAVRALRGWSEHTRVPLVDLGEAVRDNIVSGDANPDGIHWGWAGHTAVANAMTKTLYEAG